MEQLQNLPKAGEFYRHFKGDLYQILAVAEHAETKELLVVYQALYGKFKLFACPLAVFQEPVKDGTTRFTKTDRDTIDDVQRKDIRKDRSLPDTDEIRKNTCACSDTADTSELSEKELYELMEKFYDADSYEQKLDYLLAMRGQLNDIMLTNIAISLDIVAQDGSLEERFQSIVSCLKTMKRYQNSRLR